MNNSDNIPSNLLPPAPLANENWPWIAKKMQKVEKVSGLPRFSIVTASFNQGKYIEQTIRSVLLQGYPNFEYIVIDGGSTDETVSILKKYEKWLTFWISEKDKGCPDALNKGLSRCQGDYFYYLNSDDYLHEQALFTAAEFIRAHPNHEVYYGHGLALDDLKKQEEKIFSSKWSFPRYLCGRATFIQQGTFIDLKFLKKENISFNLENRTCWDGELVVDMALKGARFRRLPFSAILATFRVHTASITGSQTLANVYQRDLNRIREKILRTFPKLSTANKYVTLMAAFATDLNLLWHRLVAKLFRVAPGK